MNIKKRSTLIILNLKIKWFTHSQQKPLSEKKKSKSNDE